MCTAQIKASLTYSSLKPAPTSYARIEKFQIVKTLSSGPACKVKLGKNVDTKQEYAIKVLKADMASPSSANSDPETNIHIQLTQEGHPNILSVVECLPNANYTKKNGFIKKVRAFVMEYVEEGNLYEYLKESGPLSEEVARTHFVNLINSVQYVHDHGIVHMNLRPENLLFNKDLELKITGFTFSNYAFAIESSEHFGLPKALDFSAPEVSGNKSLIGFPSDIFSCGAILFTMVTGRPPFGRASSQDVFFRLIMKHDFSSFWKNQERDGVTFSEELKTLINGMLAYDPAERLSVVEIMETSWFLGEKRSLSEIKKEFNEKRPLKKERKDFAIEKKNKESKAFFLLNQAKIGQIQSGFFAMHGIRLQR